MKFLKNNMFLVYGFSAISILLIIIYGLFYRNNDYNNLKLDKSKQLVYTIEEIKSGNYKQYIPYLNINNTNISVINDDIYEYINNFRELNNVGITYEYNINGKVLSLVLKVENHGYAEAAALLQFRSYNLDLDTLNIVSNDKLLSFFNINTVDVQVALNNKIEEYYDNLVNNEAINLNECDYDCFLKSRNLNDNVDDIEYYVRDGKLFAFKPYTCILNDKEKDIVYDFEIK